MRALLLLISFAISAEQYQLSGTITSLRDINIETGNGKLAEGTEFIIKLWNRTNEVALVNYKAEREFLVGEDIYLISCADTGKTHVLPEYDKWFSCNDLKYISEEEAEELLEIEKEKLFLEYYERCLSFGFKEDSIPACIQQEVFNEKKLMAIRQQQTTIEVEKKQLGFWGQVLSDIGSYVASPEYQLQKQITRMNNRINNLQRQNLIRSVNQSYSRRRN